MNINATITARGRFKLVKHTGHTFDTEGNLVALGEVLEETPFQDNTFTAYGSALMLDRGTHELTVALTGDVYLSSSTIVSTTTTRNTTPDNGMLWWRTTYRFSLPANPALDPALVRFDRVHVTLMSTTYVWVPVGGSLIPTYGGTISTCDLENSVRIDRSSENIDVVWEFTEYVPTEVTGTLVGRTYKGGAVVTDTTNYTWTLRPANFGNSSLSSRGWLPMSGSDFPGMRVTSIRAGVGTIQAATAEPLFSQSFAPAQNSVDTATVSTYANTARATFGFTATAEDEAGFDCLHFVLGHFEWQVQVTPPIRKKGTHMLRLSLSTSVVNRG